MLLAYARISTTDEKQNIDNQIQLLLENGVEEKYIYQDKCSGATFKDREGLQNCLKALRSGDTLVVTSLDRLSRNLKDILNIISDLENRRINLKILTGTCAGLDTTTSIGKMFFQMAGMFAELESNLISERVKEGMRRARARGTKGGRPTSLTEKEIKEINIFAQNKDVKVKDICKRFGIGRTT
ncbi:MAG: recombinase family protein, partial [Anaplasmataceae bacterium]|nr:recombinase family protein [Anaplasmataceae bacterium]